MAEIVKSIARSIAPRLFRKLKFIVESKQFKEWEENGYSIPPPHIVKQKAIAEFQCKS